MMEFVDHAIGWCKGEIFEARLILLFGMLMITSAILFYKVGVTPGAKAMLFPLIVVGIMFSVISAGMLYSNPKRIIEFKRVYSENPQAFVKSEKERTENFISWYPKTRYIMTALGIIGIMIFLFWADPIGRAIGISLIIIMLATFVVDHFSEERAEKYHKHIVEALK